MNARSQVSCCKWWVVLAAIVFGGMMLIVNRTPVLSAVGHWLNPAVPAQAVDFVMVLPGAPRTRPFVATAMIRRGMAKGVLTSQVSNSTDVEDGIFPREDVLLCEIFKRRGVRDDQITVLPGSSNSTFTDATALRQFLVGHPQATVAVVTSDYHVRRSQWIFRKVLEEFRSQIIFVAAPTDEFSADNWWRDQDGIKYYLAEYCKLAAYFVVYGGPEVWGGIAGTAVAVVVVVWMLKRRHPIRQTSVASEIQQHSKR